MTQHPLTYTNTNMGPAYVMIADYIIIICQLRGCSREIGRTSLREAIWDYGIHLERGHGYEDLPFNDLVDLEHEILRKVEAMRHA